MFGNNNRISLSDSHSRSESSHSHKKIMVDLDSSVWNERCLAEYPWMTRLVEMTWIKKINLFDILRRHSLSHNNDNRLNWYTYSSYISTVLPQPSNCLYRKSILTNHQLKLWMILLKIQEKQSKKKTDKKNKNKINQADEKRERCVVVQHRKKTDAVVNGFSRRK